MDWILCYIKTYLFYVTSMAEIIHTIYGKNKLDRLIQLFQLLTEMHIDINKVTNKTKDVFLMYHFIICTIILV